MNHVILGGNVCDNLKDNLRFTKTGKQVLDFSLAVRESDDHTNFIRCRAWAGTADILCKYVGKGDKITVSGRLTVSKYDKDGETKFYTTVVVGEVQFGFKPGKGDKND